MKTVQSLATYFMTTISLLTAFGVFLHDGRVDKAVTTRLHNPFANEKSVPIKIALRYRSFVDVDKHTHPDHSAAQRALLKSFAYQSPSIPPRNQEQKKHLQQECQPRGHHAFDNYNLPIVA
ncbi:hypothetical protein EOL96_02885 [Candidatus Saccharibacteria bacterium]|nr:hypothetical protein [Candidatus Saccharibacteria bacterium]